MRFVQRLLTVVLVKALLLVKLPITWVLTLAGWSALFARNFYSVVVKTTSVWQTSKILLLLTLVMSIGEATNATAVSGQPWPFVIATAIGVGAVWGLLHHTILVLLLLLLMLYLFVVQKKDSVSAALPSTAVLIALAEPPLKAVAMILYLATAIYTHWRTPKEESSSPASDTRIVQPLFMVIAAVFVGLTAGSRYYTAWNTLWLAKG
ncbi:hypothetical protein KP509_20G092300 [Ceratopteris richardii]|nr:hypothetical protein KP509_20G092300 [Ceratopteris richardii]